MNRGCPRQIIRVVFCLLDPSSCFGSHKQLRMQVSHVDPSACCKLFLVSGHPSSVQICVLLSGYELPHVGGRSVFTVLIPLCIRHLLRSLLPPRRNGGTSAERRLPNKPQSVVSRRLSGKFETIEGLSCRASENVVYRTHYMSVGLTNGV